MHLVDSLWTFLVRALRLKRYELVAPEWTNGWMVEIRGNFPPHATMKHVPEMLHALLIERFGLITHTEARTMDAYQLLVGATGVKMREVGAVNELDKKFDDGRGRDRTTQTDDGPVRTMGILGGTRWITSRTSYDNLPDPGGSGSRTIRATRMTMAELVSILTLNIGEPVFDGTGLKGIYQFTIELPPDEALREAVLRARIRARERSGLPSTGVTDDRPPATATTLRVVEKLGLRLQRLRMPVDVVVVDSLHRQPTEN